MPANPEAPTSSGCSESSGRSVPRDPAALAAAKRAYEAVLWARVSLRLVRVRLGLRGWPPRPAPRPVTGVLNDASQWQDAVHELRRLGLPTHRDKPKNWDALGALRVVLDTTTSDELVIDAGSARYSPVLPWLCLYGYRRLLGLNLEFDREIRHGPAVFRHGDITATGLPGASAGAITCLSVIEHGVPLREFFVEAARLLRPGGALVVSTDYDQQPPNTTGRTAYGAPVHIFSPAQIRELVATAQQAGLHLLGTLAWEHAKRPVLWQRLGLRYTFILLSFVRA